MKKYCFLLGIGLLLIGCTEQEVQSEVAVDKQAEKVAVNVSEPAKCNDVALEKAVRQLVQEVMTERDCDRGEVYVVETRTGHIKVNVSLERTGTAFTPWKDRYTEEQSTMVGGATYLALLSTGKMSADVVIDTQSGVYKDVKDSNWRKGGYGPITLEQALCYRSVVALTKAKEEVFKNNRAGFNEKINKYLAGQPNSSMGILAFYNAVANGGRMLKLVNEGNGVTVLDEQIEEKRYIEELQQGLCNAVSIGYYKKTGRPYTYVAACGRTFETTGKTRRMELCGYFPADNPMYTIMVVMEKDRLPAAAGSICGPIMAGTIDLVVDRYNLRSKVEVVERQPQSVVVEVDTIG